MEDKIENPQFEININKEARIKYFQRYPEFKATIDKLRMFRTPDKIKAIATIIANSFTAKEINYFQNIMGKMPELPEPDENGGR